MYVELVGHWISGPVDTTPRAAGAPPSPVIERVARPIDWPRGEDGTISLRLTDELGHAVVLDLAGSDSIKLAIGFSLAAGAQRTLAGTAGRDAGQYLFAVAAGDTRDMSGPQVYEVRAVRSAKVQAVAPPAYFTVTPSVAA